KEVQPLLNRNCIACHNDKTTKVTKDGSKIPDFKTLRLEELIYEDMYKAKGNARGGPFAVSYNNLNPYVNRPGPESNNRLLNPMEFHASTSILVQKLRQGHHGVKLSVKEWEKLYAWIDLNVPFWSSFTDAHRHWSNTLNRTWAGCGATNEAQLQNIEKYRKRRIIVQKKYANIDIDYEADQYSETQAAIDLAKIKPIVRKHAKAPARPKLANWPRKVTLGDKVTIKAPGGDISFRKIQPGKFIQGGAFGKKSTVKAVKKTIYFAEFEVTNALYNAFDKTHSSRFMDRLGKDQTNPGIDARGPKLPVIRVSYNEAVAYAKWLSKKMGKKFRLPTETEWEYAAAAGTDSDFYWGDVKADFGKYANLSDKTMYKFNARQTLNYYLRIDSSNDGAQVQTTPGRYKANDFGLYDMIGNVREWTSTRNDKAGRRITKGGSWQELPRWTPVSSHVPYLPYQKVFNVGFRLVLEQ
ncbi:MAG: SUMF1/EgtB/PvdO family nonheme iron enzyme, partial [Lentisphaeria bacterium]|nr:SUMF1/EgtB/PvdO family nonheme iron enzyme [Lentisphaeria bacterium]